MRLYTRVLNGNCLTSQVFTHPLSLKWTFCTVSAGMWLFSTIHQIVFPINCKHSLGVANEPKPTKSSIPLWVMSTCVMASFFVYDFSPGHLVLLPSLISFGNGHKALLEVPETLPPSTDLHTRTLHSVSHPKHANLFLYFSHIKPLK